MSVYERLIKETAAAQNSFIRTPLIQRTLSMGVNRETYLAYLKQAYHHVRLGVPLLALGAGRAPDKALRYGLYTYIEEEKGHEEWILEDIDAIGGDRLAVENSTPNVPCKAMIGYVHYAVEHVSPYAVLGLSHVLENTAVGLAGSVASKIREAIGGGEAGFKYLSTHGAVDVDHIDFFKTLVSGMRRESDVSALIDTAIVVYRLFGDMFNEIDRECLKQSQAETPAIAAA